MDEVKQHQTEGSMWTVLKGRVYNLSPYLKFHPGGVCIILFPYIFKYFVSLDLLSLIKIEYDFITVASCNISCVYMIYMHQSISFFELTMYNPTHAHIPQTHRV